MLVFNRIIFLILITVFLTACATKVQYSTVANSNYLVTPDTRVAVEADDPRDRDDTTIAIKITNEMVASRYRVLSSDQPHDTKLVCSYNTEFRTISDTTSSGAVYEGFLFKNLDVGTSNSQTTQTQEPAAYSISIKAFNSTNQELTWVGTATYSAEAKEIESSIIKDLVGLYGRSFEGTLSYD